MSGFLKPESDETAVPFLEPDVQTKDEKAGGFLEPETVVRQMDETDVRQTADDPIRRRRGTRRRR